MDTYLKDDIFDTYFSHLKSITDSEYSEYWAHSFSRKSMVDILGIEIPAKTIYYTRTIGSRKLKLSRKSMDLFLYLLFEDNNSTQVIASKIENEKREQIMTALIR